MQIASQQGLAGVRCSLHARTPVVVNPTSMLSCTPGSGTNRMVTTADLHCMATPSTAVRPISMLCATGSVTIRPSSGASAKPSAAVGEGDPEVQTLLAMLEAIAVTQLQMFCNLEGGQATPPTRVERYSLADVPGGVMLIAGSAIRSANDGNNSSQYAALTVAAAAYPGRAKDKHHAAHSMTQPGLFFHWATSKAREGAWRGPPHGWHSVPSMSYDVGGNAWQTTMEHTSLPLPGGASVALHTLTLLLPMSDIVSQGGLVAVLKAGGDKWIKDGGTKGSNFFFPTAGLPSADATARPEVLRKQQGSKGLASNGLPVVPTRKDDSAAHKQNDNNNGKQQATTFSASGSAFDGSVRQFLSSFKPTQHSADSLKRECKDSSAPVPPPCQWMIDTIVQREHGCERSLMHRYSTGAELVDMALSSNDAEGALAAVAVWLRFSACRLLVWNRNYNIKPREISAAQGTLAAKLASLPANRPGAGVIRSLAKLALASTGRGGAGEVGQRIRDEILAVQQNNGTKGGMMEEWHQKLHNNTSPDDVHICEALLAYIAAGMDISAYWKVLGAAGITAQRMASYDRSVRSEPRFSPNQAEGLTRDLTAYLHTLKLVHGGADLSSAAANVLGYSDVDMKGKKVTVPPLAAVATPALKDLLSAISSLQRHLQSTAATSSSNGGGDAVPTGLSGYSLLLQLLLEARHMLRPFIEGTGGERLPADRLVDVVFLDMALETASRAALETCLTDLRALADQLVPAASSSSGSSNSSPGGAAPPAATPEATATALGPLLTVLTAALEGAALSAAPNQGLCDSLKWLQLLSTQTAPGEQRDRTLQLLATIDRLKRDLTEAATATVHLLQPTAVALGAALKIPKEGGISIFAEEVVRGGSSAPLSQVIAAIEPRLRQSVGGGDWQIISRGDEAKPSVGPARVAVEPSLVDIQHDVYSEPTILVIDRITGQEEIPEGVVAVLVGGQSPDILSHSAVRARNTGTMLACCYNDQVLDGIKQSAGKMATVSLAAQVITFTPA